LDVVTIFGRQVLAAESPACFPRLSISFLFIIGSMASSMAAVRDEHTKPGHFLASL